MQIRRHLHVAALVVLVLGLAPADAQRRGARRAPELPPPSVADLQAGKFVQVEGRVVRGAVVAAQVEFYREPKDEGSIEAVVEAVDRENNTLTILGRTISISDTTVFQDGEKQPILFADVRIGDKAKVKGTAGDDGVLAARKVRVSSLEADEPPGYVKIKALIEETDLENDTIVLYATTVTLDSKTEYKIYE